MSKLQDVLVELKTKKKRVHQLEEDLKKATEEYHEYALSSLGLKKSNDGLTVDMILDIFLKAKELDNEK